MGKPIGAAAGRAKLQIEGLSLGNAKFPKAGAQLVGEQVLIGIRESEHPNSRHSCLAKRAKRPGGGKDTDDEISPPHLVPFFFRWHKRYLTYSAKAPDSRQPAWTPGFTAIFAARKGDLGSRDVAMS